MPFDCTDPRAFGGGHDPAPTWGERLMAWTAFAMVAFLAGLFALMMALWLARAIVTGEWVNSAGCATLTAFLFAPLRPSLHKARALAAGRWP